MRQENRMLHILIVNGWSDLNKGDSGIVMGMINALHRTYSDVEIYMMSEFGHFDPRFASAHTHLHSYCPDLRIVEALFPYPLVRMQGLQPFVRKILAALKYCYYFIRSLIILFLPKITLMFLNFEGKRALRVLMEADLVLSKGGHIFYYDTHSPAGLITLYKHLFPLLLARKFKKPMIFYSQSFGPFRGWYPKNFVKYMFSYAYKFLVREKLSAVEVARIGVPQQKIVVVPDAAFAIPISNKDENLRIVTKRITLPGSRFVVITPRQWGKPEVYQKYIEVLANTADWLVKEHRLIIMLVAHTQGPTELECDQVAVRDLYQKIYYKDSVTICCEDFSPQELIALYSQAYMLIGTRFHSVIFSLLGDTPAVAISYFGPKSHGIMQDIGLDEFVLDIGSVNFEDLKLKITSLMLDYEKIVSNIRNVISDYKKRAEETPLLFKELINKSDSA